MPCCGTVEFTPTDLQPGATTALAVTLRIGRAFGPLTHHATVITDAPDAPRITFRTRADVHPPLRVEPVGTPARTLAPGESGHLEFDLLAFGTADDPPFAVSAWQPRSRLPVEWVGAAERRPLAGTIIEHRRRFAVSVAAGGDPGAKADGVRFVDEAGQVALDHPIRWTVAEAIRAIPSGLVQPSLTAHRELEVSLNSTDRTPFRVLGASADDPGIDCESIDRGPGVTRVVMVRIEPTAGRRVGDLSIVTDHRAQPLVRIPYFIAGPEGRPNAGE